MSTPMNSDQHAQFLPLWLQLRKNKRNCSNNFKNQNSFRNNKLEGVKLLTYGGRLDESFQLYKKQVEQYFFARRVDWKRLELS